MYKYHITYYPKYIYSYISRPSWGVNLVGRSYVLAGFTMTKKTAAWLFLIASILVLPSSVHLLPEHGPGVPIAGDSQTPLIPGQAGPGSSFEPALEGGWFTENAGQVENTEVRYVYTGPTYSAGFTAGGYLLTHTGERGHAAMIKVSYEGAGHVTPEGRDRLAHTSSFLMGKDPGSWRPGLENYGQLVYESLYEGIDLVFYTTGNGLKYDFLVSPGADPGVIRWSYEGVDDVYADLLGDLHILTRAGELVEERPFSYQGSGKERVELGSSYQVQENTISVLVEDHDPEQELVIDPLIYSSFLGGGNYDLGRCIALDPEDNIYMAGYTNSTDLPTTPGCYDDSWNGDKDIFVAWLGPDGRELLGSTFIGGSGLDVCYDIALDSENNIYITGETNSPGFPTTPGCLDDSHNGEWEAFVVKLSRDCSKLLYSTFLGGEGSEGGQGIEVDSGGNAYVTGYTNSVNFSTTAGCYDDSFNGEWDAFVVKLDQDGSGLVYSSYVGGEGLDDSLDIVIDPEDNAYITGYTSSSWFPVTEGCYSDHFRGGYDVFVTKMDPEGAELIYSTYVGNGAEEWGTCIAVGQEKPGEEPRSGREVYVSGQTRSGDFPTTPGCYDDSFNGFEDGFVLKLDPEGAELVYSSFIGGEMSERVFDIAVDQGDDIYLTGDTGSVDFPTTTGCIDDSHDGASDTFVARLSTGVQGLIYSSYVGGEDGDIGCGLTLNSRDEIYITGGTTSGDFLAASHGLGDSHVGSVDVVVFKLNMTRPTAVIDRVSPNPAPLGETVYLRGHGWDDGSIETAVWHSSIDGELHNGTGTSFNSSNISAGEHTIRFQVMDNEGLWSEEAVTTLIVTKRPLAYIDFISPAQALDTDDIRFKGHGTDDGQIRGFAWSSSRDGEFYNGSVGWINILPGILSNGSHTIYFKVRDDSGMWSEEVSAQLDINGKPRAGIDLVFPNPAQDINSIRFRGMVKEDGIVTRYVWKSSIDGEFYNGTSRAFYHSDLSVGTHTLTFLVQDDHGIWSDEDDGTLVITKYIPPDQRPSISISSPSDRARVSGEITITGTASDDGGIMKVECRLDDGVWEEAQGSTEWSLALDTTTLEDGWHSISMRAFDGELHSEPATITIEVRNDEEGVLWPDFSITREDINLTPPLNKGKETTITVTVRNVGTQDGSAVMDLHVNNISKESLIGTGTVVIPAGGAETIIIRWVPELEGDHELIVVLESRSETAEGDEDNNQARRAFTVESEDEAGGDVGDGEGDGMVEGSGENDGIMPNVTPTTVAAGAGIGGLLLVLGVVAVEEGTRYKLFLTMFPLFSRLTKEDIEKDIAQQNIRGRIYQHIIENPGTYFSLVLKNIKAGYGNTCYHLDVLERSGFVKSMRKNGKKYYFKTGIEFPYRLQSRLSFTAMNVLNALQKKGTSSVSQVAEAISKSVATTSYNIKELERKDMVKSHKENQLKMCSITEKGKRYFSKHLAEQG